MAVRYSYLKLGDRAALVLSKVVVIELEVWAKDQRPVQGTLGWMRRHPR